MTKPWGEKQVKLSSVVIGGAITLVVGFLVGFGWNALSASWGPYLGFGSVKDTIDLSSLESLYSQLKSNYDGEINKEALIEGAKKGMVSALGDIYSDYMTAEEAAEYKASLEGDISEGGVGVELSKRGDYVKVIRTLPDNPARRAGVLAGDIIYAINDEEVWDQDTSTIATKLRGEPGTTVKLTVVRDNQPLDFELTREVINNVSVDVSYIDDVAVISVYRFSTDTGKLVASFADDIKSHGATKLILDLRNNGGGYVSAARDLLSLWLNNQKAFTQKSKNSLEDDVTYTKRNADVFGEMETVVLTNAYSASASEIVAGALKDYEKATIVGETTFGKGVVQELIDLPGGALLKLTTASWYTPSGTNLNGNGVEPDIEVERTYEQINADIDPQLDKALEILRTE